MIRTLLLLLFSVVSFSAQACQDHYWFDMRIIPEADLVVSGQVVSVGGKHSEEIDFDVQEVLSDRIGDEDILKFHTDDELVSGMGDLLPISEGKDDLLKFHVDMTAYGAVRKPIRLDATYVVALFEKDQQFVTSKSACGRPASIFPAGSKEANAIRSIFEKDWDPKVGAEFVGKELGLLGGRGF